jgi:hypothetical protein
VTQTCPYCQVSFTPAKTSRFCCSQHRSLWHRDRRKAEADAWKEVIIEQAMVAGIYHEWMETDPRKALAALIAWEVSIALDPKVSSAAQALIDQGKAEAQKDLIDNPAELS